MAHYKCPQRTNLKNASAPAPTAFSQGKKQQPAEELLETGVAKAVSVSPYSSTYSL